MNTFEIVFVLEVPKSCATVMKLGAKVRLTQPITFPFFSSRDVSGPLLER